MRSDLDIADDEYDRRPRDFSHMTAEQHEEMRQNDTTGEHGRWEDEGHEHDREMEEASAAREDLADLQRAKIEQEFENEQVRRMERTGQCPCCGRPA